MSFTSLDDLILEISAGKQYRWDFFKTSSAPQAAGSWHSVWTAAGDPGAGAAPAGTPGTVYSNTAGSINFPNQAVDTKHITSFSASSTQNINLVVYDRLVAVSGLSLASTGNRTISSDALSRYADGVNVQAWLEVTTATATTAPVVSLNSYTDHTGATGIAGGTVTFPAAATVVNAMIPLPLNATSQGVRAASTLNVATAASAGVVNFVLLRPLARLELLANVGNTRDLVQQVISLPRVFDGASLALMFQASSTTATTIFGAIDVAYG